MSPMISFRPKVDQPGHQPDLEMGQDVADEVLQAELHAGDEIAEESDRIVDDRVDHAGRLGEDRQQHVLELQDRLDEADHRFLNAVPPRLVVVAESLRARLHVAACLRVALRQLVHQRVAPGVDRLVELLERAFDLRAGLAADALQVGRQLRHLGVGFCAALDRPGLGRGQLQADEHRHRIDGLLDLAVEGIARARDRPLDHVAAEIGVVADQRAEPAPPFAPFLRPLAACAFFQPAPLGLEGLDRPLQSGLEQRGGVGLHLGEDGVDIRPGALLDAVELFGDLLALLLVALFGRELMGAGAAH
jgi:hypothetical protein